jgi:putative phosphoesterase
MRIGVISDTHGFFDPRIPSVFEGVEHILHAGDIGDRAIIRQLAKIAPVTAVLGNNDAGLEPEFKETEVIQLGERKFLIHHIVDVHGPQENIRPLIEREAPDVVVFGHSHQPHCQKIGTTLYFNAGYAGRPRFTLERSVAVLHCGPGKISAEFKPLR